MTTTKWYSSALVAVKLLVGVAMQKQIEQADTYKDALKERLYILVCGCALSTFA